MTTTPTRVACIWPTLNSILLQKELPEKIHIWLPETFKRFKNCITNLPEFLKNHPLIDVRFVDTDYGPATKLLPALAHFKQGSKKIIVIDDDSIYPKNFIQHLLKFSDLYPNSALTLIGSEIAHGKRIKSVTTKALKPVDVLHGYGGYLVKPEFFTDELFNYPEDLPAAFFQDDVWISGWLKKNETRIYMIPHPFKEVWQNLLLRNSSASKKALCMNENQSDVNFLKTWDYF